MDWFEANKKKPVYVHLLQDWGQYTDPESFATLLGSAIEEAVADKVAVEQGAVQAVVGEAIGAEL
jgi:hypothetical protein